ncbi:MAG: GNAT family N-acetyltransferase [Woeseiaceae bacterium]
MDESELSAIGITRSSVGDMLDSGSARAWCAESEGSIVGFSLALRDEREINALFVLPEHERHGIGTKLLNEAVKWLLSLGDEPVRLATDPRTRAYSYYLKRGWRDLGYGRDPDDPGSDRYLEYKTMQNPQSAAAMGVGVAIGVGVGVAIGAALKNMGVGLALGVAIGVAIGASVNK